MTTSSIPKCFRPDSMLGVPGLMRAYRAGNVTLANAVGTGVADDKAIYPFVDEMIQFYLGEEPILPQRAHVSLRPPRIGIRRWRTCDKLVVKAVNESGGYGMLMGPSARPRRSARSSARRSRPSRANFIAQPVVDAVDLPDVDRRGSWRPAPRRSPPVHRQRNVDMGSLPGGLTGRRRSRDRWSSTRAREAAARTPGSWSNSH